MDVRLSAEQQALRDSAAQVLDRLGPKAVQQLDDGERTAKLDAAIEAAGWRQLRVPEGAGAPVGSGVEAGIIAEELGRGLADAPFIGPTLAAELRRLARVPEATAIETVLLAPGLAGAAFAPEGAVAVDAQGAGTALMVIRRSGGHALAEVDVIPVEERTDLTRPAAVPRGEVRLLADPGGLSEGDVISWTALGLALTCADLVGTMAGTLALATEYAVSRRQYGVAIGTFQAVQHLLADALVALEGSRSVALHAAWAVDALAPADALLAAATAKAYCARAALAVCETSIQVHGGIGNTWECLAHVFLRRALLSGDLFGGAAISLTRVLSHHGIEH